jgi:hypothetical protein
MRRAPPQQQQLVSAAFRKLRRIELRKMYYKQPEIDFSANTPYDLNFN